MTQRPDIQRPTGIYILACLFFVAPLGNILLSLALSGISNWHEPAVMISSLAHVAPLDWVWLGLLPVTGGLLLIAHKTFWSLAIVTLFAVLSINVFRLLYPPVGVMYADSFDVISTLVTFSVLALAFYFRYPYLDRRSRWLFPTAHRYELQTNVEIVAQDIFEGVTESISMSGSRIRLKRDIGSQKQKLRFVDVIYLEMRKLKISCEVVEYSDNILRLRHKNLTMKDREILSAWLKST